MSPDSYLARLERDFDAMFRLPPINPHDPLAEVEASEGTQQWRAMMNKYVIRYTIREGYAKGDRVRRYFRRRDDARTFAKLRGLPQSQIKAL